MSLRTLGKCLGVSAMSVSRAWRSDRLPKSVRLDERGKPKCVSVALARQEWAANTDLSKAPGYVKVRGEQLQRTAAAETATVGAAQVETPASPAGTPTAPPSKPTKPGRVRSERSREKLSLVDASAREKDARARLAELEYRRKTGELVDAEEIRSRIMEAFTQCRTKMLSVPSKAKIALPHLSKADILVFQSLIAEQLTDLAAPVVGDVAEGIPA